MCARERKVKISHNCTDLSAFSNAVLPYFDPSTNTRRCLWSSFLVRVDFSSPSPDVSPERMASEASFSYLLLSLSHMIGVWDQQSLQFYTIEVSEEEGKERKEKGEKHACRNPNLDPHDRIVSKSSKIFSKISLAASQLTHTP